MKCLVVGAGIVGVSAALVLAEAGAEVTVLERGTVAGEASGLNAGVIGGGGWGDRPNIDVALRMGSREKFLELSQQRGHDIGLDLTGTLTLIRTESEWEWARAHVEADRIAGHCYELLSNRDLLDLEPAADPDLLGAILDPLAARAEPIAATQALAAEAVSTGAVIRDSCALVGLRPLVGGGWEAETADPQPDVMAADVVIVAAGPWCAEVGAMLGVEIPIVPVRGQMWASEPQPPMLRHAIAAAESAYAWDSEAEGGPTPPRLTHRAEERVTRHLYGCQRPNGEIIFGGDRVLTTSRAVDPVGITTNHAHVAELLPQMTGIAATRTWAGLMPFSLDGRPLLGPIPDCAGVFLAGGLASSGFGRGPMAGELVANMAMGVELDFDMAPVLPAGRVSATP